MAAEGGLFEKVVHKLVACDEEDLGFAHRAGASDGLRIYTQAMAPRCQHKYTPPSSPTRAHRHRRAWRGPGWP
jgi:hypothetical protein